MSDPQLERARADAEVRRQTLLATAHELQARLRVGTLAEHALERIKETSEAQARKRPVTVALAAAGIVGLIAAGPLVKLTRWATGRGKRDGQGDRS